MHFTIRNDIFKMYTLLLNCYLFIVPIHKLQIIHTVIQYDGIDSKIKNTVFYNMV